MSRRYSFWDMLAGIPAMDAEYRRLERVERQKERERQMRDREKS